MRNTSIRTLFAGLAAGFLGIALAQVASADTYYTFRTWSTSPGTCFVESPATIERVVTSPIVLEKPATTVIERPMTIERPLLIEQKEGHHLLNLKLF